MQIIYIYIYIYTRAFEDRESQREREIGPHSHQHPHTHNLPFAGLISFSWFIERLDTPVPESPSADGVRQMA